MSKRFELVPVGDAGYVSNPAEVWARILTARGYDCTPAPSPRGVRGVLRISEIDFTYEAAELAAALLFARRISKC